MDEGFSPPDARQAAASAHGVDGIASTSLRADIVGVLGLGNRRFWDKQDWGFRTSWDNKMFQDRRAMERNWTGFGGIEQEDAVLAVSMGAIVDRSKEFLVAADKAVVPLRERLLKCVRRPEDD
jgi:phthalate 4,5-dioxygenase